MSLQSGRVRVDVNPPAGSKASVSVSSPSATASVRGTSFYFDTMNVRVREGTVAFKGNTGYTVQVGAGSFSGIGAYSIATSAQNNDSVRIVPPSPPGYDGATTANTGGTGIAASAPEQPGKPPVTPGGPGGSDPSGPSGPGEPSTGGVDIPINYN